MKRIYKGSDLKFNVIFPACEHDITLRFYTTNSSNYITVDDESIIAGQITLKWDDLATLEEGVLYYDIDSTGDVNSVSRQQTDYYIVSGLNSSNIGGGSTVVNATWGKITGNITAQTDLVEYVAAHAGSGAGGAEYDDTALRNEIATINVTLATKANKADVYTKAEVDAKVAEGGNFDSNSYYNKTEVDGLLNSKAEANAIPTKVSQLTNDSGYLTEVPSEYVTESELSAKGYLTTIPSEYITEEELAVKRYVTESVLTNKGYLTSVPSEYVTETELNAKGYVTESALNSKGYITGIPSEYVTESELTAKGYITGIPSEYITETELDNKGYITEHQDISNLATKAEIPTKVSELTNDAAYISSIPSEYVTDEELNAKGYLTEHQDISNLATKDEIPTKYVTDIQLNYLDGSPRFATINRSDNTNSTIYFGTINDVLITSSNANFKLATTDSVNAIEARVTALENDVTAANATIDEINSMI